MTDHEIELVNLTHEQDLIEQIRSTKVNAQRLLTMLKLRKKGLKLLEKRDSMDLDPQLTPDEVDALSEVQLACAQASIDIKRAHAIIAKALLGGDK